MPSRAVTVVHQTLCSRHINMHIVNAHGDFKHTLAALLEMFLEDAHLSQSCNISWPRVTTSKAAQSRTAPSHPEMQTPWSCTDTTSP